jgi:3',5'-cyclic AMP phosphodiesterase CpdA
MTSDSPRLFALSDLHVGLPANLASVLALEGRPSDWLVLAGDVGESVRHLETVLDAVVPTFAQVVWVPGNHELWTSEDPPLSGLAKYDRMVEVCRARGVLTPEDPYPTLPGTDLVVCPLFLLYDYSFGPEGLATAEVVRWAAESGIVCVDEHRLRPEPFATREAWCASRLADAERRLAELDGRPTILVNHWPLRLDLCRLFRIPRFTPWCGTRRTEDWHVRYCAELVISGHLHMRATDWRDGVRFEEVSLGYPRQYDATRGASGYLRQVWPGERRGGGGPVWHR